MSDYEGYVAQSCSQSKLLFSVAARTLCLDGLGVLNSVGGGFEQRNIGLDQGCAQYSLTLQASALGIDGPRVLGRWH